MPDERVTYDNGELDEIYLENVNVHIEQLNDLDGRRIYHIEFWRHGTRKAEVYLTAFDIYRNDQ